MNEGGRKQPDDEDEGPAEEKSTASEEEESSRPSASKRKPVRSRRMEEYLQQQDKTVPQKQRICTFPGCKKQFSSGPGLRYHLRTHSPNARCFACDHCRKEFKSQNGLKYHMEKTKCVDTPAPPSPSHPSLAPTLPPLLHTGNNQDEDTPASTKEEPLLDETDCMQDPPPALPSQDWPEPRHRKMESKRKQLERQAELSKVAGQDQQTPQFLTSPRPQGPEPLGSGEAERLLEFANIATGPQSPLLRSKNMDWDRARLAGSERTESSVTDAGSHSFPSCTTVTSTVTSTTATSIQADSDSKALRSPSPQTHTAVWQCFSKGTKVRFSLEDSSAWYPVERLAMLILQGKGPMMPHDLKQPVPLRLVSRQKLEENKDEVELEFESEGSLRSHLTASCMLHHPFNVLKKGWASCDMSRTHEVYGLTGSPLEINDVCLPLLHSKQPVTAKDSEGSEVNRLEYSSVVALSKMAQKRSQESSTGHQPHRAPNGQEVPKAKRPMNSFLLWSQTKRSELIHKFPKTSNRNISSMLSKEWRKLSEQEKTRLHHEAKVKAERQKEQHPNCWKRKNRDH